MPAASRTQKYSIVSDNTQINKILTQKNVPHLSHHGFLVLFLLGDFDRWQLSHRWHQKIHENVLAVGHLVNHGLQTGRKVGGVQVVVVPKWEVWKSELQ